ERRRHPRAARDRGEVITDRRRIVTRRLYLPLAAAPFVPSPLAVRAIAYGVHEACRLARFASPACGGGRRARRARRVGALSTQGIPMRKHPLPNPPPHPPSPEGGLRRTRAGEGAHCRCRCSIGDCSACPRWPCGARALLSV